MSDQATGVTVQPDTSPVAAPANGPVGAVTVLPLVAEAKPPDKPPAEKALARQSPERLVVQSDIALLDTASFEHMQRIGQLMAKMDLLPKHLRSRPYWYPKKGDPSPAEIKEWREKLGVDRFEESYRQADQRTVANCILVVDQALRWGMNPFSTMGETYEVGGKLASQGKLVAAVINARAPIEGRLDYTFSGAGDDRTVTVSATFKGEAAPKTVDLRLKDARTDNDMWRKDPDQKLIYSGVVKWARRWCPEIVLGIQTDDDIERQMAEEASRQPKRVGSQLDAFAAPSAALPAAMSASLSTDPPGGADEAVVASSVLDLPSPSATVASSVAAEPQAQTDPQGPSVPPPTAPLGFLPADMAERLTRAARQAKVSSAALAKHLGVALVEGEPDYAWLSRLPLAVGQSATDCELELTRAIQAQQRLFGRR